MLQTLLTSLKKIYRDVGQFLDRVVEADSPTIVKAYEKRIRLLEEEKALVREDSKLRASDPRLRYKL